MKLSRTRTMRVGSTNSPKRLLGLLLSGLLSAALLQIAPPAQAVAYNGTSGTVACVTDGAVTGSGLFTITSNVVIGHTLCVGKAVIPQGVTGITSGAFSTASIATVSIPASVTSIGDLAFGNAVTTFIVDDANADFTTTAGVLFDKLTTTLVAYPSAKSGASYDIPTGVTTIRAFGFNDAQLLTKVTIPASVTSIGSFAFQESGLLSSFYFLGNAPTVSLSPFLAVAAGAKAYKKTAATGFVTAGTPALWNLLTVEVGVYTATYNSNSGSAITAGSFISAGKLLDSTGVELAAAPTSTRTGYTFVGWSTTNGGAAITFPYTPVVTTDLTLWAKWTQKAVATVKPTISGTVTVGKTLTAKKGTWTGTPTPTYSYQWYVCTKAVASPKATVPTTCSVLTGKTSTTLKLLASHKAKFIAVKVTGTSAGTTATSWVSKSTSTVK